MFDSFDSDVVGQLIIAAHLENGVELIEKLVAVEPRQVARHIFLVPLENVNYLLLNPIAVAAAAEVT